MNGTFLGLSTMFFGVGYALFNVGLEHLRRQGNDRGYFVKSLVALMVGAGLIVLGLD